MHGKLVVVGFGLLALACGGGGGDTRASESEGTLGMTEGTTGTTGTTGVMGVTEDVPTGGMSVSASGTGTSTTDDVTATGSSGPGVTATDPGTTGTGVDTDETSVSGTTGDTGDTGDTGGTGTTGGTGDDTGSSSGTSDTGMEPDPLWVTPNLWYSVEDKLHYIKISEVDGSVVQLVTSTITTPLVDGFNGLTMLEDGSLLGSRVLAGVGTQIFHIPEPPVEPSMIEAVIIGMVPDTLLVEALYTDCKGLVYLMDSGADLSTAAGNRLIRFTGEYLAGDLNYEVITDLQNASVADIDDLGPGIDAMGEITDGSGFAIDSGEVYAFNYNTGTGTKVGNGGTWGSHALGGPLFVDQTARLYLLNIEAKLVEADPVTLALSPVLVTGPKPAGDAPAGWSGLTGPLTECKSTLPQ